MLTKKMMVVAVAGTFAFLSVPVLAQTTSTTTTTTTTSTDTKDTDTKSTSSPTTQAVPTSKLVSEYTDLTGSKQNATSLVTGLRTGSKITLEPIQKTDKPITFTSPTNKLGNGEIKIVLAMADKLLANDKSVTNQELYNTLMNSKNGILTLRADGKGWGQIADAYGFKLGEVMGKAPSASASTERAGSRPEKVARGERADKIERPERPDRPMKPERPERPERGGR